MMNVPEYIMDSVDSKVNRILEQDKASVEAFLSDVSPGIKGYVLNKGGSRADADDTFNEGLVKIFSFKIRFVVFTPYPEFCKYFFIICKRLWINELTKRERNANRTYMPDWLEEETVSAVDKMHNDQKTALYTAHFENMTEEERKLLEYTFWEVSSEELASHMGYSSKAYARQRKSEFQKRLIKAIQAHPSFKYFKEYSTRGWK